MGALISISIISGFFNYKDRKRWFKWLSQGSLFGVTCVIGMLNPLILAPGLIFDGRSVILSLCGLFFGTKAVVVAAIMAITLRINQGGPGTIMGSCVIITSSLIGIYFYNNQKEHDQTVSAGKLFFMGILVHITMILLMFTLPKEKILDTMKLLSFPIILVYPLITVLIGKILSDANHRRITLDELQRSETELLQTNIELEATFEEITAQEEEIREQFMKLKKSQSRFKMIFTQAPIGITLSEMGTGVITHANAKFFDITGYSQEEVIGEKWMSITHPDDIDKEIAEKEQWKSNTYEYNKRYIKPDGITVWVNIKIVLNVESDEDYDEICFVEDITNKKNVEDALLQSEYNFRTLFESSTDAILTFKNSKILDCNKAGALLFAAGSKKSIIGKGISDISPEKQQDGQLSEVKAIQVMEKCRLNSFYQFEWTNKTFDNTKIIVEIVLTSIILNGDEVIHALIRDITERKEMEKQLEVLSYRDRLTGVYNRRFFEDELSRLDVKRNFPLTLMMGDVNGLKLVNDSFGHTAGDELLKKVATLIKKSCRDDDIISRIGGDEFVIIIPRADEMEVEAIAKRIQNFAKQEKMNNLEISISFGWATKISENENVNDILKKAEDYLYRKKLFVSPSMRIHTLHEKNKREEKHSRRVSEICKNIGIALGMSDDDVQELSSVGLLHDIGKIGVNDQTLNKEGKLTDFEWMEIRKHPEIGYRILSTVNEMSEMAEYVLSHHERWDGKGYPKGLKGEEIPFKARIISIADAFDAMTSERTYQEKMSQNVALVEIEKYSGTQFDPQLIRVFKKMFESNSL
jgi:diguanylate cyclase (GGDEF)-like protein/PAS domain S-box-containing protein